MPQSITEHVQLIDEQLAKIRVCDPAVGSGAFVVSMMNEVVRVRNTLTLYMSRSSDRSNYDFKRHAIHDCLYGVDIDAGAVEIAKLRLWLSLVVDEDEREKIQPLPNLDYKIVQGDSLLSVEKDLLNENEFKQLETLKPLYFNETNARKKKKYKEEIDALILDITHGHKKFDFEVYFSEVFHENQGFDIVIGNPPYVQLQKDGGRLGELYEDQGFTTFARTGDIYQLFYERGLNLLTMTGLLCYITSNKWMRTSYGSKTRKLFAEKNPLMLLDLGSDAFETATVDTNILLINNNSAGTSQLKAKTLSKEDKLTELTDKNFYPMSGLDATPWTIRSPQEQSIKEKTAKIGTSLKEWDVRINYGIKTGFNEAFIIDQHKRDELVAADPKSAEIIKPILRGRDIQRYGCEWAGKWVINSHNGDQHNARINIDDYPTIKKHLDQYYPQLEKRHDKGITPYNLRSCAYISEFEKEKVIYPQIGNKIDATYLNKSPTTYYINDKAYCITGEGLKYLTAFLNSKLFDRLINTASALGGKGEQWLSGVKVPKLSPIQQQPFILLVDKILAAKAQDSKADTSKLEAKIDQLVYPLYGLTAEEIKIVEES